MIKKEKNETPNQEKVNSSRLLIAQNLADKDFDKYVQGLKEE